MDVALGQGVETLWHDLRFAARTLLRTPGWTSMAVVTLALGTGANAAVFSFVDALLFKPAPATRPARPLVAVYTSDFSSGPYGGSSYPDYVSMKTETDAFRALSAVDDTLTATMKVGDDLQRVRVASVTPVYFDSLGVRIAMGRGLREDDAHAGAPAVAIISHTLWQRALLSDPAVLGTAVTINGRPRTIAGVAPPRFSGIDAGRPCDVWTALDPAAEKQRDNRGLRLLGQLRDGVSIAKAQSQLGALAARLAQTYPETNLGTLDHPRDPRPFLVMPATRIGPAQRAQVAMVAAVLMGGVGLVLLLACANVASLMLSRATTRVREIAVRRALGAAGFRILRQLLTEAVVVSLASAGLAMILAAWTTDVLPSFFPPEQAASLDVTPGWRGWAFVLALAFGSAVLIAVLPAIRAVRPPLAAALRGAAGDVTEPPASRARDALVVTQIAIACVLLVAASLLMQSVSNQLHADLGFSARQALLATVDIPESYEMSRGQAFYDQVAERLAAVPGVQGVAWLRSLPMTRFSRTVFAPEGYTPRPGEDLELPFTIVSADYFQALGIAIEQGRAFTRADTTSGGPRVVVVNEMLSRRFFGGHAVGRRFMDVHGKPLEIVGVARTGRYLTPSDEAPPTVYFPLGGSYSPRMSLFVRTGAAPERFAEAVRREVRAASGDVAVFRVMTLQAHVEEALAAERLSASLVTACAVLSALLAVVGLYAAVAYLVTRRTREIGLRVALGAQPRHVVALVVRHGLGLTVIGIAIGVVAAAAVATLLQSMLYGVSPISPLTHTAVALGLASVAALAAYIPARRAVRLDPIRALGHE
jgi:predicted permease